MKVRIVVSKATAVLLGGKSMGKIKPGVTLGDEVVLELEEETVQQVFDLFDEPTFEASILRLTWGGS